MSSALDTLQKLGPVRLAVLGIVMFALMGFFVFISLKVSTPSMKLLYAELSTVDSAGVAAKLEDANIQYQVSPDGSRVMVPENEIGRARMLLAEAGLPNGGSMGYEIFDQQSGFGTTNFVQNINQVRALEGELARTIASIGQVSSARVHLVLPQRELFARESRPSSGSVFIKMKSGGHLSAEQIAAIQALVSNAVPDLKTDHVSVIDAQGNLLARGGADSDQMVPLKAEEMRRGYEARLTTAIEDMIGRTVGFSKVRATVTADLNFDRISTNEESFNPEQQVVRSSQTTTEDGKERDASGGDVSAGNNVPGSLAGGLSDSAPTSENKKVEETTNYEIGKTVKSLVREVGEVKRLSVAVLIDGTTVTAEDGKKTYTARPEAELKQIETLVKSAIGFDEKRGDQVSVINMPFAEIEVPPLEASDKLLGFEKNDLLDAAQVIVVTIAIVLVVLLILQPMMGRLLAAATSGGPDDMPGMLPNRSGPAPLMIGQGGGITPAMLGAPQQMMSLPPEPPVPPAEDTSINVKSVEGAVKASSVKKVEDIVAAYPNETVSVLRSWMTQD